MAFHAKRIEKLRATTEYTDRLAELDRASAMLITELDEVLLPSIYPKHGRNASANGRLKACLIVT